jgi:hypothetical protein
MDPNRSRIDVQRGFLMISDLRIALGELKQLPLTRMLSAGAMPMFAFGELRTAPSPRGGTREIGTFELHVQCAWRLVYNASVYMGSGDYHAETDESDANNPKGCDDFIKIKAQHLFTTMSQDELTVKDVSIDEFGGFKLFFHSGTFLEVFPNSAADETEYWRLFKPGVNEPHVVCEPADHE